MNCVEKNWLPSFTEVEHSLILECLRANLHHAANPFDASITDYVNLHSFPNKIKILSAIFHGYNIDPKYINSMSIQEIRGGLKIHRDKHRTVSLLYPIIGQADTVFYNNQHEEVEVVRMDLCKWYLFNNNALHNVRHIDNGIRVGLVVDLSMFFADYTSALTCSGLN